MISIREFAYSYPGATTTTLEIRTWEVADGEFVLVAGRSGSGKSTLLRTLNGVVPHFTGGSVSGTVEVDGLNVLQEGPQAMSRKVGFVSQNPEAHAVLDRVEAEIAFPLENAGLPPTEMRLRVEEVLDLLSLSDLRDRPINSLSGGERQRVAIGVALGLRPNVLVLDEPTSQLDPLSANDVLNALVRLNEDLGLTIILAEHRLDRILQHTDRLTYLDNGLIVADGEARDVVTSVAGVPPVVELGRRLGWQPIPLTIKDARKFAQRLDPKRTETEVPLPAEVTDDEREPLLEVDGLDFAYNGHRTLRSVSLAVQPGEAVALLGRNGSGKTTLLRCIVGLLKRRSGDIKLHGHSIVGRDVAEIVRTIGYLPQYPDDLLYADSVTAELNATMRNHGFSLDGDFVLGRLRQLGLAELADRYPRDLSVGQRQRVAFGAVTVNQPQLLLMDEPTRGLDRQAKDGLVALWREWLASGMGLLLVTHDVELAAAIASRAVVLSDGEVIAQGKTADVLRATPQFAPQMARLFPATSWLTVDDVLAGLNKREAPTQGANNAATDENLHEKG